VIEDNYSDGLGDGFGEESSDSSEDDRDWAENIRFVLGENLTEEMLTEMLEE
jgi:hypothetical protein